MSNDVIIYLRRNEIDEVKYNRCIENSHQSRIYAYSWYLDIVADDWCILVLGDYKVVMPIPLMKSMRNFYFKKIEQPPFCQQLGLFYNEEITGNIIADFISFFKQKSPFSYQFNSANNLNKDLHCLSERKNFELYLGDSYEIIRNQFSKNLIRNIKKANKNQLKVVEDVEVDVFMKMKVANKKHKIKNKNLRKIDTLIVETNRRKYGCLYGVLYKSEIIATAFITKNNGRMTHLFSASTLLGKQLGAISYLFDDLIKKNCGENIIFDFEGGSIPNIARFNKSFGAKNVGYFTFLKSN